jgi:Chitinase
MRADQIPSGYTHVHFAFAGIAPDLTVDFLGLEDEFRLFASQTRFKRILAFGGWSFSTNNDSVPIFRPSFSSASRLQFARNVANLVQEYNLNGVDFDWEFPADPAEGNTYLTFLASLRSLLPAGKTVSVATPASYYHLKNFPIAQMASVVDYVVFMTYDLHGQWDYGSSGSQDGCPNGDCLRSHVNLTETNWALSIITKAGVPSNKVVVGIASYGRSFRLADPNCISPLCRYTGPESQAEPGPCTRQRGIIAQAEIEAMTVTRRWYESTSDADYAVYGPNGNTWTSYLSDERKQSRINRYRSLNLGGSAEWAIDLAKFLPGDGLPSA